MAASDGAGNLESQDFAIRVTKRGGDRGVLAGASEVGKSTLAKQLCTDFYATYIEGKPPKVQGRELIIDTKPRWRGTQTPMGGSLRQRYKNFVPGDTLDAVVLNDINDFELAFDGRYNNRAVIAQNLALEDDALIRWQVQVIRKYFNTQKARQPSLLYIDEGMDFFGPTGNGKYGNIVQRCVRAGREKNLATLIGVQRTKTINLQVLTECNVLYLFMLNYEEDVKRLHEMGFPRNATCPTDPYIFRFYRDRKLYPHGLTLARP
jgi:cyanate lyase